jgi:hypothetical protein
MQPAQDEIKNQLAAANIKATELISLAENMFGSMCTSWKYIGVIFQDQGPHLCYYPEARSIQISLSFRAIDDEFQRDFQLAHEVCHLLYPTVEPDYPETPQTNIINEGISTYFSIVVLEASYGEEAVQIAKESLKAHSPRYFFAFQQVLDLLSKNLDAIKIIREIQPKINKVNKYDLRKSDLEITEQAISDLVSIF